MKIPTWFTVVVLASSVAVAEPFPRDPLAADIVPMLGEPRPPPATMWRRVDVVEGIVVCLAPSGMRTPWASAEGLIDAPIDRVLAHLIEFERLAERVPYLERVDVIKRDPRSATVYFYFDLPWPISNRDYTVTYRWGRAADGHIGIVFEPENGAGPPPGDAVRVDMVRGRWQLLPTADGKTFARYEFIADFGGILTRSDEVVWRQPLETIRSIRKVLAGVPLH